MPRGPTRNLPYRIGEMPFGVGTPPTPPPRPPRKVRSNKGIKRRKPNVVLNNKGDEVLNMISQAPIPKEYAIQVQKQEYDARELLRWFEVSKTFIVPHTRDKLISTDVLMIKYRAYGSRQMFKSLDKKLNDYLLQSGWPRSEGSVVSILIPVVILEHFRDIDFYNFLFFRDYLNLTTNGQKVKLHPLPKGLYSKKDDIEYFTRLSGARFYNFLRLSSYRNRSPIIVN